MPGCSFISAVPVMSATDMEVSVNPSSKLRTQRGSLVADVLSGSWKTNPSAPGQTDEELSEIAPLLLKSGAGALAWCKVRRTGFKESSAGDHFHQAYRLQSLEAELHKRRLKKVIPLFR